MTLDRDRIAPVIELMGYQKDPKNDVWKRQEENAIYGVDFTKGEIFKFEDGQRVYEDTDDKILNDTIQAVQMQVPQSIKNDQIGSSREGRGISDKSSTDNNQAAPSIKQNATTEDKSNASDLLELIHTYVGDDVLEVFGDTGTGKSKFALTVAQEAIAAGKKVFYLDTERNLTEDDIKSLGGGEYKYTPLLAEIAKIARALPAVDVVIMDSIGFPVLTTYARLSVKQKGDALLELIAIFGDLKAWAYKNNGVAVVTNQPESEFNKAPGHVLRPFGDKSQFAAKEIWKTEITSRSPAATKCKIAAFRSRSVGHTFKIADMEITGDGVKIVGGGA